MVELFLDAVGVGVASLFPVHLERLPPGAVGVLVLVEGGIGVAELVEDIGDLGGVAEMAAQG